MNTVDEDLECLLRDYPMLNGLTSWLSDPEIRSRPRDKYKARLTNPHCIKEYLDIIHPSHNVITDSNPSFLYAHFSPLEYEMEAMGLPAFTRKKYPHSVIHTTYDKGGSDVHRFEMGPTYIQPIQELADKYDIIIARSSVLNNMNRRTHDSSVLSNSRFKVNIKTMSLSSNLVLADHYFEEEEMCPPPDPSYLARTKAFLSQNKKQNLIVVSGTLWNVKNQLEMFRQLDQEIIRNFKVVIVGGERDKGYANKIRKICLEKNIEYYMIGWVCKELAQRIKSLSKISLIPMDMRVFGQPKGYPRTLGESLGSKCITLCNKPVTIPEYFKKSCFVYDESVNGDFNKNLAQCITLVSHDEYFNSLEASNFFTPYSMEELCEETLNKIMKLR